MAMTVGDWLASSFGVGSSSGADKPKPSKTATPKPRPMKPITQAERGQVKSGYSDWILGTNAKTATPKPSPSRTFTPATTFTPLKPITDGERDQVKSGYSDWILGKATKTADKPSYPHQIGPTAPGYEPGDQAPTRFSRFKDWLGIGDDDDVTPIGGIGPGSAGHTAAATKARQDAERKAQKKQDVADTLAEGRGIEGRENPYETEEMSWEDFKKLGRRQKAVVDLNTLQADASAADMELGLDLTEVPMLDRVRYEALADKLGFDGNRGSERYAPNTLALIKQLGLNTGTRDLDEFIDLSVASTRDELKNLRGKPRNVDYYKKRYAEDPNLDKYQLLREDEQRRWAEESGDKIREAMTKTLEKGNEVLSDFRSTMEADRSKIVSELGATPREIKVPTGYGPGVEGSDDRDFQSAYMALQDASAVDQRPAFFEELSSWNDKKLNSFFSYADQRSRNERKFGMPELTGPQAGMERIAIPEFRDMLGLS